jgi:hypothetical protein
MDWKLAMQEERAVLKRIIALLFALADLAESACNHSPIVRRFVIWILRAAETVAREFVVGEPEAPALMPVSPASDSPAEAMRLAYSFRDLAHMLDLQAKLAFAVRDDAGQAGVVRSGARERHMVDFLNAARRVACAPIAHPAARGTCSPDTS